MKINVFTVLSLALWSLASIQAEAQHLRISNFSVGSRAFEARSISGNPFTVSRFLKQPEAYTEYLGKIQYTGSSGSGGFQSFPVHYITAELSKPLSVSPFWRKNTIMVGLSLSNKFVNSSMSLINFRLAEYPNGGNLLNVDTYEITAIQRFLGATAGINKRLRIVNRLDFFTGLHAQGSIAVTNNFEQRWDSTTIVSEAGQVTKRETKTRQLSDLKGKNFFQWQAMIPVGLELEMYRKQLFVRLEADFGLVGSAFHSNDFIANEMHGAGLSLVYKLP